MLYLDNTRPSLGARDVSPQSDWQILGRHRSTYRVVNCVFLSLQRQGMWSMPQEKVLTLARLAGQVGLKTRQAQEAAENLGLNLRRGAATVRPWQEKILRPELERMSRLKKDREFRLSRPAGPVRYEADDDQSGYLADGERPAFPNGEMRRLLNPILSKMLEDDSQTG